MSKQRSHIIILMLLMSRLLVAQQNLTLFLMHDVPQAGFVNPAVSGSMPWIIGVPALASIHASYANSAFSMDEGLRYDAAVDSFYLNFDAVVNGFNSTETVMSSIHYTPLFVGFWVKENWVSISLSEKVTSFNTIPREAARLAWYGNTPFVGREASLDGLRANAYHYRDYALGLARNMSARWSIGLRAHLLWGKGAVYTPRTQGGISTNANNFGLLINLDSRVHSSLPIEVGMDAEGYVDHIDWKEDIDWKDYLMNRRNMGVSFDLGFIYRYDDKTTFSGSLLNLGFIAWKTSLNTFVSSGTFAFTGTDSSTDFNGGDYAEALADSLRGQFLPSPNSERFTTRLAPEIYLGATRKLRPHLNAGTVFYGRILRNKLVPAFTLSVNTLEYKTLNASLSYTAINGDYLNIGAGIGLALGMFHLHAVADNVPGLFRLEKQRNLSLRLGLSIVPVRNGEKEEKAMRQKGVGAIPCYHSPYKGERKKRKR
ncbi:MULTISPECIES: DUF5723 family protein [unclassified Carboxylicivirga]|uniref:DUF5723 family protein n=1 Tax=Carboxylicivirga TaxID=1628153 RepID=UPI003D3434A1